MLNIAYTNASVVFIILHYTVLRQWLFFAYPIKSNISTRKEVTQILPKKLYNHFS